MEADNALQKLVDRHYLKRKVFVTLFNISFYIVPTVIILIQGWKMSWFTDMFTSGASDLVDSVGNSIDKIVTSDEERLTLRNELESIGVAFKTKVAEFESAYQEQLTKRWESDNKSESWLAKNVRPLSLVYLMIVVTLLAITDGNVGGFSIKEIWITLFTVLTVTAFTAYFGSRGYEKVKGVSKWAN